MVMSLPPRRAVVSEGVLFLCLPLIMSSHLFGTIQRSNTPSLFILSALTIESMPCYMTCMSLEDQGDFYL